MRNRKIVIIGILLSILFILSCISVVVHRPDEERLSPLHRAVRDRNFEQVDRLVRQGFQINIRDSRGNTPLHYCAFNGEINIAGYLLDNGAAVDVQNRDGDTPLHLAFKNHNEGLIGLLLNFHADPSIKNNAGESPASLAGKAGYGDIETIGNEFEYKRF